MEENEIKQSASWIFPKYFGDTAWGKSPTLHCTLCQEQFGYAFPTDRLFLKARKGHDILVCKKHN